MKSLLVKDFTDVKQAIQDQLDLFTKEEKALHKKFAEKKYASIVKKTMIKNAKKVIAKVYEDYGLSDDDLFVKFRIPEKGKDDIFMEQYRGRFAVFQNYDGSHTDEVYLSIAKSYNLEAAYIALSRYNVEVAKAEEPVHKGFVGIEIVKEPGLGLFSDCRVEPRADLPK